MMWSRTLSVFGGSYADNVKPKDNTAVNVKDKDKIKDVSGKTNVDGKGKEKLKEKSRPSKLNSVCPSLADVDGENDDSNSNMTLKPKSKSTDIFGTLKRKTSQRKKKKSKTSAPPSSPSDSAFELTSDPSKENTPPGERDSELEEVVTLSNSNSIPSPIQNAVSELTPIFESSLEETTPAQDDENPKSNPEELNASISNSDSKEMVKSEVKQRKIKKPKENSDDDDKEIREISFFYSEEDERFAVKPRKNPTAILLGIDSLIKFTKFCSDPDNIDEEGQIPWNSFEFVLNASVGKECEHPNLKSPDLIKFFNKFGSRIVRARFNFSMFDCDCDVSLTDDDEENKDQEPKINLNSTPNSNGMQLGEFVKILNEKLPSLESLSLSALPDSWRNVKIEELSSMKLELVELETLVLEKYVDYSKHKEILSLLLKSAPNLTTLQNFQLVLLDTLKEEGKLHVIKDIELVHPTFLSQSIWVVEDYFEVLRKFTDLVCQQEIKLEQLLVIPDEGFINNDNEVNSQFSELYAKLLEGSKDTLKTWSIYPLVSSALPVMPSSGSWSMGALTTLKLYEFDLCQKGVFKQGTIFKDAQDFTKDVEEVKNPSKNKKGQTQDQGQSRDPATDSKMDFSTIFPKLTKVELSASKFFQKYHHSLTKNSSPSLKFPTVTELDLNLGSSRPSVGAPFLYNLFDLFRDLSKTFPNVIHLKIRCYQKVRYVLRALASASPGFKDMKSLYIQAIDVDEFITEFRRRDPDEEQDRMIVTGNKNKLARGNSNASSSSNNNNINNRNQNQNRTLSATSNKKSGQGRGREAALINAFLALILEEKEEPEMIQIDMDKIRVASEKKQAPQSQHQQRQRRGHSHKQRQRQRERQEQAEGWPISGLLGLDHLTVGMASHDLDHEPYFEGFRLQGPFNFNLLQVARIKDNMDLDKVDLEILGQSLTESELMELYDSDDDSDSDFDYERYFGFGFGVDYFCPYEGVDPYEVYQKELERKMDFALFMNGDSF